MCPLQVTFEIATGIRDVAASAEKFRPAVAVGAVAARQRDPGADRSRAGRVLAVAGGGASSGVRLRTPHVGMDDDDS